MTASRLPAIAAICLAAAGCAPPPAAEVAPPEHLSLALEALDDARFAEAEEHLRPLADREDPVGRRALLLGAALALDPRNPDRDPGQAAERAARYVATAPDRTDAALARVLYGLALDLGAVPAPASDSISVAAADLPRLQGPSLATRLHQLESAVTQLRAELTRIQRTLDP